MAEMERFELSRRSYRPTGVRSQTLQPLGYISISKFLPVKIKNWRRDGDSNPGSGYYRLHDFQSCSFGHLGHLSKQHLLFYHTFSFKSIFFEIFRFYFCKSSLPASLSAIALRGGIAAAKLKATPWVSKKLCFLRMQSHIPGFSSQLK